MRHSLSGDPDSRIFCGSKTTEWLYGNFADRQAHGLVYFTAASYPYQVGVASPQDPDLQQEGIQSGHSQSKQRLAALNVDSSEQMSSDAVITAPQMVKAAVKRGRSIPISAYSSTSCNRTCHISGRLDNQSASEHRAGTRSRPPRRQKASSRYRCSGTHIVRTSILPWKPSSK